MFAGWANALEQQDGGVHGQAARSEHQRQMTNRAAFTLIELLVVVAIIAVLVAILMPMFGRARKRASAVACRSNLKQWGTTLALYTQENQGRLPGLGGTVWLIRGAFPSEGDPNEPRVGRSIRTQGIACCPMAMKPLDMDGPGFFSIGEIKGRPGATFRAWQITSPGPPFLGSYGLNVQLFRVLPAGSHGFEELDTFSRKNAGAIPVLLDSALPVGGLVNPFFSPPRTESGGEIRGCIINRHNGYVNGMFLDWSVRPIGIKELWTLKWDAAWNTAGPWTKAGGGQARGLAPVDEELPGLLI